MLFRPAHNAARMAKVILENLTKSYIGTGPATGRAVNQIDLTIEDREFMVLVGPSGCGKSTTLRLIAGLEQISAGTVSIDGRIVNEVPPKDRDIAMVFQNYALYPHLSVYDNLAFGLKMRGVPRAEIEPRVREAAAMLGLGDLLARKPKALSGGQRQRVALGRAIVRQPKVFLFDEPLSNLDARMRVSTRAEISKLHRRLAATMIYVTHDQAEAMTMGDRICVMKDGNIMQVAPPLELYNHPANMFVAGFIGSPPMNFFRGTITRAGDDYIFVETNEHAAPLQVALDAVLGARAAGHVGLPIIFGVRPEAVRAAHREHETGPGAAWATLELAEPMGAETFLHLSTGATTFIARLPATEPLPRDQRFAVQFDLTRAHLFDAGTEAVLR